MDQKVKEAVEKQREAATKFLQSAGLQTAGPGVSAAVPKIAATTYSYPCTVSLAVGVAGYVVVIFSKNGSPFAKFEGGFAPGFGGYTGWGTAWFNKPVEELIGRTAGVAVEVVGILGGTAHVQIADVDFIGNCSTGGIGIGAGAGAGAGKFSSYS
jgi:hypothetical protein